MCLCRWNMCRMCLHWVHISHDDWNRVNSAQSSHVHDWAVFKCFVSMLACFVCLCVSVCVCVCVCVCVSNSQLQMSTSCWFHTVWILCTGNSNPIREVQEIFEHFNKLRAGPNVFFFFFCAGFGRKSTIIANNTFLIINLFLYQFSQCSSKKASLGKI